MREGVSLPEPILYQINTDWIPGQEEVFQQSTPDSILVQDLNHFYRTFSQVQGSNLNSIVASLFKRQGNKNFYVYNAVDQTYKKFELVSPYVGLVGMYQPMNFPWQKNRIQSCPSANAMSTMPTWLAILLCAVCIIIGGALSAAYFSKKHASADNSYIPM